MLDVRCQETVPDIRHPASDIPIPDVSFQSLGRFSRMADVAGGRLGYTARNPIELIRIRPCCGFADHNSTNTSPVAS
jgi:hypothetical protein